MIRTFACLMVIACSASPGDDAADTDTELLVESGTGPLDTDTDAVIETDTEVVVDTDTEVVVETDAVDTELADTDPQETDTDPLETDTDPLETDTDTGPEDTDAWLATWCPGGPYAAPNLNAALTRVPGVPATGWSGFGILEGPVWFDDRLHVSLFGGGRTPGSTVLTVDSAGTVATRIPASGSNGLAWSGGLLYAATHDDGALTTYDLSGPTPVRATLADGFTPSGGSHARFNAPNDLVVRHGGNVYFTDPDAWQAPSPAPQAATRVYRVTPAGDVQVVDATLSQPNGVAVSLDGRWLFVSGPGLAAWPLAVDGAIDGPRVDLSSAGISGADGMSLDCAGRLYIAMGSQVVVVQVDTSGPTPMATRLGALNMPGGAQATNVAFGGPTGRRFYVTTLGSPPALYQGDVGVPGPPW